MWLHPAQSREISEVLSTLAALCAPCPPHCWFKLFLKQSLGGGVLTGTAYFRNASLGERPIPVFPSKKYKLNSGLDLQRGLGAPSCP